MKKENLAILTSPNGGLAHYALHLINPFKKYFSSYYLTYSNAIIDDLLKERVEKIYPLITNESASSILLTLQFLKDKKIKYINFHIATTARKMYFHHVALLSQAKLLGIKVVGTLHDVMPIESLYIDPAAIELLYSCLDHYIVGNEAELHKLQLYFRIPDKKISIINHGPYLIFDNKKFDRTTAQTHLGIPPGKKVVLFFGRLRPYKGLKYLIKAFKKIIKEVPNAWLYIASDLSYAPELNEFWQRIEKAGISKNIQLQKKYVPSFEIEPIFKAADLVALPYTQVSQSGILNLAFAFKKPVVVTNVFPEANLINYKFGRVARAEDVATLEQATIDLLNLPKKELARMGEAGYRYATKMNSWERAAEELHNITKKI